MAEPLNATFFAFQKREPRFVLTRITIAYLVIGLALGAAYMAAIWPFMGEFFSWYLRTVRDATQGAEPTLPPQSAMLGIAPWAGVYILIVSLLYATYEAACLRWLTRGERGGGLFGLRLSGDTLRLVLVYLTWIALFVAVMVGVVLFYLALRAVGAGGGALGIVAALLGALAPLAAGALMIWLSVRFAPAAAVSVARGRYAFFETWSVTRGRFWPLLGAFFLVTLGYIVIASIIGQVIQIPLQQKLIPVMSTIMHGGDVERGLATLQRDLMTPFFMVLLAGYVIVATILVCVFRIALFGVNARVVLADEEARAGGVSS